tara:strand:+ start:941 stop:1342 length:402 start_codon:yes stop_codon:yes gene_type:complete
LGVTCKINVVLNSNGNPKISGVFSSDNGVKRVKTINESQIFDLEEYCKEFSGESCAESKLACDSFDTLPRFVQWRIKGCDEQGKDAMDPCFEVQAAIKKGAPKEEKTGLSGIASSQKKPLEPNNEIMDDDIPF